MFKTLLDKFTSLGDKLKWQIVYALYVVSCVIAYSIGGTIDFLHEGLSLIIDNKIVWLVVIIAFGGDIVRKLYFKTIQITSGFIPLLKIILEAATYGLVIQTAFVFLNALVTQFWVNEAQVEYFNSSYFGNFDFLTLAFASIFIIAYTSLDIRNLIINSIKIIDTHIESPVTEEDFKNATSQSE